MTKKRDFLSRSLSTQMTGDVTKLFVPKVKGKQRLVRIDAYGVVHLVAAPKKVETVLRKKRSAQYVNTVKKLAGVDDVTFRAIAKRRAGSKSLTTS